MIIKDLTDFKAKFDFVEGGDGWIELRFIPDMERKKAVGSRTKRLVEYQTNPKTGRLERLPANDIDFDGLEEWSVKSGIVDWGGLYWENHKAIECTDENKLKLYFTHPAFRSFVDEKWKELQDMAKQAFGGVEKTKN